MGNAFDSANYPTREPATLIVGDRWVWKRTDLGADYPPASYTLKYAWRLAGAGATEIEITATASGNDYLIEIPSAITAAYVVGSYTWQAYITRNADLERLTIDRGSCEIRPNRDVDPADPRGHAAKVLDQLETVIEALTSKRHAAYSFQGRTMTYRDLPELLTMRSQYQAEVQRELRADRIAAGLGHKGRVLVRF